MFFSKSISLSPRFINHQKGQQPCVWGNIERVIFIPVSYCEAKIRNHSRPIIPETWWEWKPICSIFSLRPTWQGCFWTWCPDERSPVCRDFPRSLCVGGSPHKRSSESTWLEWWGWGGGWGGGEAVIGEGGLGRGGEELGDYLGCLRMKGIRRLTMRKIMKMVRVRWLLGVWGGWKELSDYYRKPCHGFHIEDGDLKIIVEASPLIVVSH